VCGVASLTDWVAAGHDKGSSLHATPTDDALVAIAMSGKVIFTPPHGYSISGNPYKTNRDSENDVTAHRG
jgi:hypothetical protein